MSDSISKSSLPRRWPWMLQCWLPDIVRRRTSASLALASASGWSAHRADHRQAAVTPLPAPLLPSSSRRYAPQCFVGEYTSSPCDVSHRASDEPRRCMSLSSALAPSSLASPSIRRVCLRSFCARRRSVSSLSPRQMCRDAIRCYMTLNDSGCLLLYFVRAVISFCRG